MKEDTVIKKKKEITTTQDFHAGNFETVFENKRKITKEYNVLSPALGRGAFGEVRKAVHRETGHYRAIKIVFKNANTEEDIKRMLEEVTCLIL